MTRAIVVGAGVIGASVAYHLARAGCEVVVVDRARPGGGTSMATFAWVNARSRRPEHYHRFSVRAMAAHRELQEQLGHRWQYGGGCIEWADDRAGRDALADEVERLDRWGYAVERLTPPELRRLEPALGTGVDQIPWAAWFGDDTYVHPNLMIAALLGGLVEHGGRVRGHTDVIAVDIARGQVRGVRTASGERLSADIVVDCAGPAAGRIGRWFGIDLPLGTRPGLILVTEPAPTRLRTIVRSPQVEVRPDGGGRLLVNALFAEGALDPAAPPSLDDPICVEALARTRSSITGLEGVRIEAVRVGVRPMPDDGLPLIGPVGDIDGAYVVVTHSGVSLAPLVGRLVAHEIVDGRPDPALSELRPDRRIRA